MSLEWRPPLEARGRRPRFDPKVPHFSRASPPGWLPFDQTSEWYHILFLRFILYDEAVAALCRKVGRRSCKKLVREAELNPRMHNPRSSYKLTRDPIQKSAERAERVYFDVSEMAEHHDLF